VMMLKAAATFQLTSHISYRRANTV
jgi:hypothetical protein